MMLLVLLYAFSGVFRVETGEYGVMARLGQLCKSPEPGAETGPYVFKPGWYRALPDPFDRKIKLPVQVQALKVTTFMFNHPEAETAKDLSTIVMSSQQLTPGVDGAMYTGDRNLSHGRWDVQYRIGNAEQYVRNIGESVGDGRELIQRLLETAVVREVAHRTVEEVTRTNLRDVADHVKKNLQDALNSLHTGIEIVEVAPLTIEPGAVHQAFTDVGNAESERDRVQREAEGAASETLSHAAGPKELRDKLLALIRDYGAAQLQGADEKTLGEKLATPPARSR